MVLLSIPLGLSRDKIWREKLFLGLVQNEINLFALLSICTKPRKSFSLQILSLDKPSGIDNTPSPGFNSDYRICTFSFLYGSVSRANQPSRQNRWGIVFCFLLFCFSLSLFIQDGEWGREGELEVLREVAVARMSHCFTSSAAGRCHVCRLHVGS